MAKSKNKSRSEAEYLRGEIRKLKRQLRECQKIKNIELFEDAPVEDLSVSACQNCGKGIVTELDLGFIIIRKCETCGDRKTEKKAYKKSQGN